MPIKITMRGIEAVQEYLKTVPRGALKDALAAFTEYIVGNKQHGLKHADPYKFVPRSKAYPDAPYAPSEFKKGSGIYSMSPKGYFSWAQFHKVGMLTNWFTTSYTRTKESTGAWDAKPTNGGYGYTISNPTAGAYYTRSDTGQARQPAMVGWRKVARVIADNTAGAMRAANAAVKRRLVQKK
jgi:hypothetical protein